MGSRGSSALHGELQSKCHRPVSRPDGAQGGRDTPSTLCKSLCGSLEKGLKGCGSEKEPSETGGCAV